MLRATVVTSFAWIFTVCGIAACGSSSSGSDNGDGGAPVQDAGGTGQDGGGATDSGPTTDGGQACAPGASCTAVDKSCIGLVDNRGMTKFGLRMSQVTFAQPTAFSTGLIHTTLSNSAIPNLPACNLKGTATFTWLLQFDTTAGTITTGAAQRGQDGSTGYAFDNETLSGFAVQPATMNAKPDSTGSFGAQVGADLNLPVFLDAAGTNVVLLPIRQARITMGTLSSSQNCIGSYNAAGLDPSMSCEPDTTHPAFVSGGRFDGFIRLVDADQVTIAALGQSLCVFLSWDTATYGDGATPVAHCKKDANQNIVFQGDWCSTTNSAAGNGCADAVRLSGDFAAGSVKIN